MASAAELTEPRVLAHAKRRLFPESETDSSYAVVDTQVTADRWLADGSVDEEIRSTLAPFNHVRVGSCYPDLVGVTLPDDELIAVDRFGDEPPMVVVEANGYTDRGVDVERGVVQAHDRLDEANAAYVAAPVGAVSQSNRTLARELNVGVLAVTADGGVQAIEVPRVVGNRTTSETSAIRFQASAPGVTDRSFSLNHPKNYLAYPLAVAHRDDADDLVSEHVVGATDGAREAASFLGLVEDGPDGVRLTGLGREVVRFARHEHGTLDAALRRFEAWKGSRDRFHHVAPRWGLVARRVVYDHPATELLVGVLQRMQADDIPEPSLVDLVTYLHELHPSFTVELFVRGTDDARHRVLDAEGALQPAALTDGSVYHSPMVFQLKAMLYHAGILTERGAEPSRIDPSTDVWALRHPV
jgi:hypothetical protein